MDDMKKYDNFRAYKRDLYGGSDGSGSNDDELGWTDEWYETDGLVCLVRFPVEYLDLVKSRRGSSSSSEREEEGLPTDQPEKNNSDYITVTFELEEEEEVVEGWKEKKTVEEKLTLEELNVIEKAYLRKEQLDEEYGWKNILEEKLSLEEFNTTDRVYAIKEQEGEEEEVEEGSKKTVEKKLSLEEFNAIDSAHAMEGEPIMIPQKRKRDKPELQGLEVEELHPEQVSDTKKEKQKSKRAFLGEDSGAAGCGGTTITI